MSRRIGHFTIRFKNAKARQVYAQLLRICNGKGHLWSELGYRANNLTEYATLRSSFQFFQLSFTVSDLL